MEELWVEFFEDMLEQNPGKLYQWVGEDSEIQHVTGDANIDKIEKLNAEGNVAAVLAELDRWEAEAEAGRKPAVAPPAPASPEVAPEVAASYPEQLVDFEDFDDRYGD